MTTVCNQYIMDQWRLTAEIRRSFLAKLFRLVLLLSLQWWSRHVCKRRRPLPSPCQSTPHIIAIKESGCSTAWGHVCIQYKRGIASSKFGGVVYNVYDPFLPTWREANRHGHNLGKIFGGPISYRDKSWAFFAATRVLWLDLSAQATWALNGEASDYLRIISSLTRSTSSAKIRIC